METMKNTKISRALKDKAVTSFRDKINVNLFHLYFMSIAKSGIKTTSVN